MQIVHPQILSCSKVSNTRLLELQCSKKLADPIIILTAYSLSHKGTFSTSNKSLKSPFQAENSTLFLARTRTKIAQNAPKHVISSEKFIFKGKGLWVPSSYPSPGEETPHPSPHQAFGIRPCVPHNSSQIYITAHILSSPQSQYGVTQEHEQKSINITQSLIKSVITNRMCKKRRCLCKIFLL